MNDSPEDPAARRDFAYRPPKDPCVGLFMDGSVAVLVKPAGLLSVPGRSEDAYDSALYRVRLGHPCAQAVHRLDMDTSGLLAIALNKNAASSLGRQFQERSVRKLYLAVVDGEVMEGTVIDAPLRCDWENRPRQMVDFKLGKRAVTRCLPLRRSDGRTLVALEPLTGRSHQLRVHMALLGHPIVGDRFYAPPEVAASSGRLLLHSSFLEFEHPDAKIRQAFRSLPDFARDLGEVPDPAALGSLLAPGLL
ncbi:MAG: pseudouridine synthase [Succinivibrio sp.]